MSTGLLHVYGSRGHVAMIALPPRCADAYVPEEPWVLLHDTGRVDRFATMKEAREEATKTYAPCAFRKT